MLRFLYFWVCAVPEKQQMPMIIQWNHFVVDTMQEGMQCQKNETGKAFMMLCLTRTIIL